MGLYWTKKCTSMKKSLCYETLNLSSQGSTTAKPALPQAPSSHLPLFSPSSVRFQMSSDLKNEVSLYDCSFPSVDADRKAQSRE